MARAQQEILSEVIGNVTASMIFKIAQLTSENETLREENIKLKAELEKKK